MQIYELLLKIDKISELSKCLHKKKLVCVWRLANTNGGHESKPSTKRRLVASPNTAKRQPRKHLKWRISDHNKTQPV